MKRNDNKHEYNSSTPGAKDQGNHGTDKLYGGTVHTPLYNKNLMLDVVNKPYIFFLEEIEQVIFFNFLGTSI